MRAEFGIFESNAPGLKANFYEPYVDMPSGHRHTQVGYIHARLGDKACNAGEVHVFALCDHEQERQRAWTLRRFEVYEQLLAKTRKIARLITSPTSPLSKFPTVDIFFIK